MTQQKNVGRHWIGWLKEILDKTIKNPLNFLSVKPCFFILIETGGNKRDVYTACDFTR